MAEPPVPNIGRERQDFPIGDTLNGQYVQFRNTQPIAGQALTISNYNKTQAYAASLEIKNQPGILYGISGYNSSGSTQFIQLIDTDSLGHAPNGAIPVLPITVPAASNFAMDFGITGINFSSGILVCNSSTANTKTIGSADCWFVARYI